MPVNQAGQHLATPWYLWAVGGLAILWNGFGTMLWGGTTFIPETFLDGMSAAQREYVSGLPIWSTVTWGLGVVGGLVGSLLLLLRNRLAVPAFGLSLVGAVANTMVYVTNPAPDGFFNLPLTLFIIGFAAFLFWFADRMKRQGVI